MLYKLIKTQKKALVLDYETAGCSRLLKIAQD